MNAEHWRRQCVDMMSIAGVTTYRVWKETQAAGRPVAYTTVRRALSGQTMPGLDLANTVLRVCRGLAERTKQRAT